MSLTKESQRILWDDSGTLTDLTMALNDFRAQNVNLQYTAGDYIYIGSEMPFGFRYFDIDLPSTETVTTTVENWTGSQWQAMVDVLDGTNGWQTPGYISWRTDKDVQNWHCEDDTADISELAAKPDIYNLYWLRLSFSGSLSLTTEINTINFKFADDDDLYGRYPDLNNQRILDSFEKGSPSGTKTDWDEQHFISSNSIVRDLKRKNFVFSGNQIIDYEVFSEAAEHKCAEIIYSAMGGEGYELNRKRAREYYQIAMNQGFMRLDTNKNARLDPNEKRMVARDLKR